MDTLVRTLYNEQDNEPECENVVQEVIVDMYNN